MFINADQKELKRLSIAIVVGFVLIYQSISILPVFAQATQKSLNSENLSPKLHEIKMAGVELPDGHQAYKMLEYKIIDKENRTQDITSRYSKLPTIPGPTLVMTEGDTARLTLVNEIGRGAVSLHTHGVHYKITSDGTLKMINRITDEAATPQKSYTYVWTAADGTRGSWPWHDHTFGKNPSGTHVNGVETNGLFSTVIVNPANGKVNALVNGIPKEVDIQDIKKDFVLFITDDAFWGVEIDNTNNKKHTPLWVNPTLVASKNDLVRFHIQSVGTDFHHFVLDGYEWLKPGTNKTTSFENIGPLENHVFTINADKSTSYYDKMPIHLLSGMKGKFEVVAGNDTTASISSIPGPSPEIQDNGNDNDGEISFVGGGK
ncbi:MAG: multicopper oxidase domain-containing protein [Deltaproteobacteria bacterium]